MGGKEIRVTRRRKPLKDLSNSNSGKDLGTSSADMISIVQGKNDEELLLTRRLQCMRSRFSALNHQVNELVSLALESKCCNEQGRKHIEDFVNVVDDIHSSLKPWIPKLKEATIGAGEFSRIENTLSSASAEKSSTSSPCHDVAVHSLVSPSPLVCWKGNKKVEQGNQLFLLTPLPMNKRWRCGNQCAPESVTKVPPAAEIPSLPVLVKGTADLQNKAITQTPKVLEGAKTVPISTSTCGLTTTTCVPVSSQHVVLRTPFPPDHISHDPKPRKLTPFRVATNSDLSESSSNESSETLRMKYPELLGIRMALKTTSVKKKDVCSPPLWSSSPSKSSLAWEEEISCLPDLGDPPLPSTVDVTKETANSSLDHGCGAPVTDEPVNSHLDHGCGSPVNKVQANVESTPRWKEPESILRTGKRPGESTLKKELWTKFEAVSLRDHQFNVSSTIRRTARKGFLDMLDEVSEE